MGEECNQELILSAAGPRDGLRHLLELARQWLRPDTPTQEQIVKMLVQEQFQAILPEELRAQVQKCQSRGQIHWLSLTSLRCSTYE